MGIHNYDQMFQGRLKSLEKKQISDRNKKLIKDLISDLILENLSKPRLVKYIDTLSIIAKGLGKDLDKATEKDLKKYVGMIQQRSDLSVWTKQSYKVIIRRFYRWLHGTKEYPEIVKWINIRLSRSEKKLPCEGDLLNEKDIEKLISVATHPRDKALVSMLWESGARISEIGNLCLKNIVFDEHGMLITVQGKTGSRKIRLIWSVPYLSTWISNHPERDSKDASLWINIGNTNFRKPMSYENIRKTLIKLGKNAKISKRVNPHIFRHSRATFMANHLTEFQMNQYFGWIQGSDMPATYVHMSGKNVDDAILTMNKIKPKSSDKDAHLVPIICKRCDTINSNDGKYCLKCGGILDISFAMELEDKRAGADQLMAQLLQDKDVQALLMEKMQKFKV